MSAVEDAGGRRCGRLEGRPKRRADSARRWPGAATWRGRKSARCHAVLRWQKGGLAAAGDGACGVTPCAAESGWQPRTLGPPEGGLAPPPPQRRTGIGLGHRSNASDARVSSSAGGRPPSDTLGHDPPAMPGAPPPSVRLAGEDAVAEHALGVTTRPPRDRIWLARTASRTVYANAALACRPPSGSEKPDTVLYTVCTARGPCRPHGH
jgi:hypothetical protein